MIRVEHGDSREVLRTLAGESVDSCVTDPPYSLVSIVKRFGKPGSAPCQEGADGRYRRASAGFMGEQWDTGETAFDPEFWSEVLRVLKPGAHLLAFGGTRSYHRLACAIEDAGFEIRDAIMWHYGSGFPKSHDVERSIAVATCTQPGRHFKNTLPDEKEREPDDHVCPMTPESEPWDGWGTALKPATEILAIARKPLSEGTVAANVLQHGTGAINVDGCRVGTATETHASRPRAERNGFVKGFVGGTETTQHEHGRWPANVIHDGSDEVMEAFPQSASGSGRRPDGATAKAFSVVGCGPAAVGGFEAYPDAGAGTAARFFYCAKASKADRAGSKHPTVKPISLLRYLCRLVTPPGGTVLDPFAGSGTLGAAAHAEGFGAVLIEREDEYVADIRARIADLPEPEAAALAPQPDLFQEAA